MFKGIQYLLIFSVSICAFACASEENSELTSNDSTMMTATTVAVANKPLNESSAEETEALCNSLLPGRLERGMRIVCVFAAAFSEGDMCVPSVNQCISELNNELQNLGASGAMIDTSEPCIDDNPESPSCVLDDCINELSEAKESGCTVTDTLIAECDEEINNIARNLNGEDLCSETQGLSMEPPANGKCQELQQACPSLLNSEDE